MSETPDTLLYPVGLDLTGARILVVGAGVVAARKVQRLVAHEVFITVISPKVMPAFQSLLSCDTVSWVERGYESSDLTEIDPLMVFACTDEESLNTRIAYECRVQKRWVNVATDGMRQSTLVVPSVCDIEGVQIAMLSGGQSPALLKQLRQQLEAELGPWVGRYMAGLGAVREQLKQTEPDPETRQAVMKRLSASPELLAWVNEHPEATAEAFAEFALMTSRTI